MRFLADENFNGRIFRALRRQFPDLDLIRAQDTPLYGAADEDLLQFAAAEGRVLLTHDIDTLVGFAWDRVRRGEAMPGVIAAQSDCAIGRVLEDLELLITVSEAAELDARVLFIPL